MDSVDAAAGERGGWVDAHKRFFVVVGLACSPSDGMGQTRMASGREVLEVGFGIVLFFDFADDNAKRP
jgi:hypothetical protein